MFLTLEDPRARVKGSRDPLGLQPVWSGFGRHIIANLTTVTNSLRGFTVLLLGRYFGERLLREGRIEEEDVVDVFLRVEQACAYARWLGRGNNGRGPGRVLGIERVQRRCSGGTGSVRIGVDPGAMILADQKTYGLWGLFSVSARASKLLANGPVGLTPEAASFVEGHYLPHLDPVLERLQRLVAEGGELKLSPQPQVLTALGGVLGGQLSAAERRFYRAHLCDGKYCDHRVEGRQATFRRLLESHSELRADVNRDELNSIRRAARTDDPELARHIDRILALEALLAPSEVIFGFLQTRHGRDPADVAETLRERWGKGMRHLDADGFAAIRDEIAKRAGEDITRCMTGVHEALLVGDYETAIRHLLGWNRLVMMNRSAGPWVRLDDRDALDVRYRGIERELPKGAAMPSLWRNSYFINALKALAAQTAETPTGEEP